jgi:hypothetical protein
MKKSLNVLLKNSSKLIVIREVVQTKRPHDGLESNSESVV